MGAVFAAAARAPITAVIIIFELTGDYRIILPLMFAIVVATDAHQRGHARHDLHAEAAPPRHRHRHAAAVEPDGTDHRRRGDGRASRPLTPDSRCARSRPLRGRAPDALPVIDADGRLLGVVAAGDVEQAIAGATTDATSRLTHPRNARAARRPDARGRRTALGRHRRGGPARPRWDGELVVGWLTHRRLLRAYHAHLDEGMNTTRK